ncbi:hypothetical protein RhiirA5_385047 [Rhizophagus irregularis]|uniref:Uncharacterized protein n=1 Tax=Rhizophagus irregularis TaxID=588596 RepID=A0A2N0NQM2_9GLOM|nr:hypothetical protein RhiirA5_385047 [Rhizophagus irregularis]
MNFYKTIEELDDKGIKEELKIWQYMYTIECLSCNKMILTKEAVEYNKKFIERICKSCYEKELETLKDENELNNEIEIEKRLERLKNLIEVLEIEVFDRELLRLISMEYRDVDILSADFIRLFQEYKNESDKEIKKILDEYLRKFDIEEENEDSNNLEKIGEILSSEEHEIWEENIKGFDENEFENENENVINTEGFGLSQNSDSNNLLNIKDFDNESEISDYNLQDLFQENILLNMANQDQIKRIIENALGFAPNALDNALGAEQTLADRIQTAGMGGIVGLEPMLEYQVRRSSPTNLNDAVNHIARREEEAKGQVGQEKNMEEILKEETNKYKKENEMYQKMQKPVNKKDIDDISKQLEQF